MGRSVVARLLARGERVIATSRSLDGHTDQSNLTWRAVDLATYDDWHNLLAGVSAVYHLAWSTIPLTASLDPIGDVRVNLVGTLRLLAALRDLPKTRLVFASSGGTVYGRLQEVPVGEDAAANPIGAYGISKLAAERYIRQHADLHGVDAVVLRIGNPYGSGQLSRPDFGAVSTFCSLVLAAKPVVIFGDGSVIRDYLHVDDAVDALLLAAETQSGYRTFNIGTGQGRSLKDIVAAIEQVLGRPVAVEHRPARSFDVPVSVLDVRRADKELDWRPRVSFETGVARMLAAGRRRGGQ